MEHERSPETSPEVRGGAGARGAGGGPGEWHVSATRRASVDTERPSLSLRSLFLLFFLISRAPTRR